MSKLPEEWEQQLKEKPFEGMNFTPQMQKKVEQRLGGYQPKRKRYKILAYAAVLLPVMAMLLWFGYSGLEPGKLAGRITPLVSEAPPPRETGAADFSPLPPAIAKAFQAMIMRLASAAFIMLKSLSLLLKTKGLKYRSR